MLLDTSSLAATVYGLNDAFLTGLPPEPETANQAARWIASRQGAERSYRGLFAPTQDDYASDERFLTGEPFGSGARTGHVLGEEACRILTLLDVDDHEVGAALDRARREFTPTIKQAASESNGHFCCAGCSVSVWRNLTAGGLPEIDAEDWLKAGMQRLRERRTSDGSWRSFPFHYTISSLVDIDLPSARAELEHAHDRLERLAKRPAEDNPYSQRRRILAERAIAILR